ncbi:DNA-methyltransferase [Enterovibrio norvegicus]|uniref:DNA-methyltransferase n=1 Tax=Enterovibrio norvegicus TaxID=188144 RepID=UPI000CACD34A|nr:site-specific DNA-methyltransferase [Enterovibrio norvegicus]PMN73128.1 hypothetical protein BCT27_12345 [Enterovibrio norvegicus]
MTYTIFRGDCLEEMKGIASGSVDLILTDPPYGTIKGIKGMRTDWDDVIDMPAMFLECFRILRPNGALILFGQEPFTSKLILSGHGSMPFSHRLVWIKEHFGSPFMVSKVPANYVEDMVVYFKRSDDFREHPLKPWFDSELIAAGLTRAEAVKRFGSTAGHYFTDGRQFTVPSESKLQTIQAATGRFDKPYAEIKRIDQAFRDEIKARWPRTFNLAPGKKFKSNVLQYKRDLTGLHPTQKPVALLVDLIETYSRPGDTVLDFTMGSGSTGVAALKTARPFIGIERDPEYFGVARDRLATAKDEMDAAV